MSLKSYQSGSFEKDLLHWCKLFLAERLSALSKARVKDGFNEEEIAKAILRSETIDELYESANIASRFGMKAMGTNIASVKAFFDYTIHAKIPSINKINSTHFDGFMGEPSMLSRSLGTQQNYSSAIVSFSKFVEKKTNNQVSFGFRHNTAKFSGSPSKSKIAEHLTPKEFEAFSDFVENKIYSDPIEGNKNTLLVKFFLYTGAKTEEIAGLKIKDLSDVDKSETHFFINVNGGLKGSHTSKRKIPVPSKQVLPFLKQFIKESGLSKEDYLFHAPGKKDTKMRQEVIAYIVSSLLVESGIRRENNTPRLLRHSYAVYLLSKGLPLKNLQELLGLESIAMAASYAECVRVDLNNIEELFSKEQGV